MEERKNQRKKKGASLEKDEIEEAKEREMEERKKEGASLEKDEIEEAREREMEERKNQRKKKVRKKKEFKLHLERRREKRNKRGASLGRKTTRKKENEKEKIKEKGEEREREKYIKIFPKRNASIPNTNVFRLWLMIKQLLTKTSSSRHGTGKVVVTPKREKPAQQPDGTGRPERYAANGYHVAHRVRRRGDN